MSLSSALGWTTSSLRESDESPWLTLCSRGDIDSLLLRPLLAMLVPKHSQPSRATSTSLLCLTTKRLARYQPQARSHLSFRRFSTASRQHLPRWRSPSLVLCSSPPIWVTLFTRTSHNTSSLHKHTKTWSRNYTNKHEENHKPAMNGGVVIKTNAKQRYASDAIGSFVVKKLIEKKGGKVQEFEVRNDMCVVVLV